MELAEMNEQELLDEAVKQGYNPDYDGANKKTPKEFLEVSFNHNKMLKERNESLSRKLDDMSQQMFRLVQFTEEQKRKAVDKAIRELKAQRKEAISDGDVEQVEKIDKEIDDQKNTLAKPESNPILDAWLRRNAWYQSDEELGIEADILAKQLQDTGRFAPTPQDYERLLKVVEDRIKQKFPERFTNPKKADPPDVEGGQPSGPRSSKKSYADLPPEAKRACDQFVADKVMTREKYLELYEWDD